MLRREGLYSSHLVVWRRARRRGELAPLTPKKRGRKPTPVDPRDRRIAGIEHRHGALGLMTPYDIHYDLAAAKWQQRAEILRAAYAAHPERFPRGVPLSPLLPTAAWINKPAAVPAPSVPEGIGS